MTSGPNPYTIQISSTSESVPVVVVEELGVAAEVELELAAGALHDGVVCGVVLGHVVDELVAEAALVVAQPAQEPAQAVLAPVVVGDDPARVPPHPVLADVALDQVCREGGREGRGSTETFFGSRVLARKITRFLA